MSKNLRLQAERLAARQYSVTVVPDETTDGKSVFVAYSPEMPNCMGQGESVEDAMADLAAARIEFIVSLLEDGIPVPAPLSLATVTAVLESETVRMSNVEHLPEDMVEGEEGGQGNIVGVRARLVPS